MSFIRERTDVSAWLIHFVRNRDPSNHAPADADPDEYFALAGDRLALDDTAPAVLQNIIDEGCLVPGYSFRNGKTTIYGGQPVVCFTEAPLYDFVKYVRERGQPNRCSTYGVCLLKEEAFAAGGRPCIYGLADVGVPRLVQEDGYRRIIDSSILPLREQYRYVAYDPTRAKPLDWTHEREWRWTPSHQDAHSVWREGPNGVGLYPGLPLFRGRDNGGFFSRVGFLVGTRDEAERLAKKLLGYRDARCNNLGEEFDPEVLGTAFVVALDEVEAQVESGTMRKSLRIEDLAESQRIAAVRSHASDEDLLRVRQAIKKARRASLKAGEKFLKTAKNVKGPVGGAWVITCDTTSAISDAMLKEGFAEPMAGQYYVVDATAQGGGPQELAYHEATARAAADTLTIELGVKFSVRKWWD